MEHVNYISSLQVFDIINIHGGDPVKPINSFFFSRRIKQRINKLNKHIRNTYIVDDKEKTILLKPNHIDFTCFNHSFKNYTITTQYTDPYRKDDELYFRTYNVDYKYNKDINKWIQGDKYNISEKHMKNYDNTTL